MRRPLVAALALAVLASVGGCTPLGGDDDLEITALFEETAGLYVGNDVGVMGVPVGTITRIEPRGDVVEVTLEVTDDDIRIPADAAAVVISRSVATDRYVELTPAYDGGAEMESGSTIPLDRTRTPVDFDEVLSSISDLASSLTEKKGVTNDLSEVLEVTAAAFSGNGDELRGAVHGLADLVDTVHGQRSDIFATMASLDRLSRGLVDHEQLVRTFVRDLGSALDLLNSERGDIAGVLRSMSATVDRITRFSRDNRGQVKASLGQVRRLIENLMESRADLAETVQVLPLATENVARSASPEGHIWVRGDPGQLLGLAPLFERICGLVGPVCNLATFPDLSVLLDGSLDGSLGGGTP